MASVNLVFFEVGVKTKPRTYFVHFHRAQISNRGQDANKHNPLRCLYLDDVIEKAIPAARASLLLSIKRGLNRSYKEHMLT